MAFQVGQHVLCITGSFERMQPGEISPIKGLVYTVRARDYAPSEDMEFIRLQEIVNPGGIDGECWFGGDAFRPLSSSRLSVFHRLLAPLKPSLALVAVMVLAVLLAGPVSAHNAPSGWAYDRWCCSGKDCAEIPASAVSIDNDGYVIRLLPGQHPMVKDGPVTLRVPYGDESLRDSPDGAYHICLYPRPDVVRCFYKGPEGY